MHAVDLRLPPTVEPAPPDAPRISSETLARADEDELDDSSLLAGDRRCRVVARVDARHAVGVGETVRAAVQRVPFA